MPIAEMHLPKTLTEQPVEQKDMLVSIGKCYAKGRLACLWLTKGKTRFKSDWKKETEKKTLKENPRRDSDEHKNKKTPTNTRTTRLGSEQNPRRLLDDSDEKVTQKERHNDQQLKLGNDVI